MLYELGELEKNKLFKLSLGELMEMYKDSLLLIVRKRIILREKWEQLY